MLKLGTYALSWSFSHANHGDRSRSFVTHCPYVPVTGVPLCCDHLQPAPQGTLCGVMIAGAAVPSMLHESMSLRWKGASIFVCSVNVYELV